MLSEPRRAVIFGNLPEYPGAWWLWCFCSFVRACIVRAFRFLLRLWLRVPWRFYFPESVIPGAHIFGEHLALPGFASGGPTLEIFGYDTVVSNTAYGVNASGFCHLAFAVDDVNQALQDVLAHGGGQIGELVENRYADGRILTAVYACDPEGNILELQNWRAA